MMAKADVKGKKVTQTNGHETVYVDEFVDGVLES